MKNKKIFLIPTVAIALTFLASCGGSNSATNNTANSNVSNVSTDNGSSSSEETTATPNADPVTRVAVTFDANGGTIDGASTKIFHVRKGLTWKLQKKYEPTVTVPSGKTFNNKWTYLKDGVATLITDEYVFNSDVTLTAKYESCTVTFTYPGGGSGPASKEVDTGTTWASIKDTIKVTPPSGSQFTNFTYEDGGATKVVEDGYTFSANVEFTANYKKDAVVMIVDPNGGAFSDDTTIAKYESVDYGTLWKNKVNDYTIKTPPTGYTFKAWQYNKDGTWTDVDNNTHQITGTNNDNYLRARYEVSQVTLVLKSGMGTWTSGGGQEEKSINVNYNSTWSDIKSSYEVTAPSGYVFTHFTNADGEIIGDSHIFTANETLTAQFVGASVGTITFRTNKGTLPYAEATFVKGQTWGAINKDNKYDCVAPAGYTFKEYTLDGAAVTSATVLNDDSTFTATFNEIAASNFVTDSWTVFSKEADKGLDSLSTKYATEWAREDATTGKVANSFIGSKRNVTLQDGSIYPVTVIGQNVDSVTSDNAAKATLTFQFDNILDQISYNKYVSSFTSKYKDSVLKSKLNGDIYNKLNDDVKTAIVPVFKATYEGGGAGKTIVQTEEKLFALSATEMGYRDTTDTSKQVYPDGSTIYADGLYNSASLTYNAKYAYYVDQTTTETAHIKKELNGTEDACAYWLRSPDTGIEGFAWNIDLDGKIGHIHDEEVGKESLEVYTTIGVAPAFAVGTSKSKVTFTAASGDKGYTIDGVDYDIYEFSATASSKGVTISNIIPNEGTTFSSCKVTWNGQEKTYGVDYLWGGTSGVYTLYIVTMPSYDITVELATGANG